MSTQYLFIATIKAALSELQIDSAKLQVQTPFMDKSLAVMLRQLCYGKISFIVLYPGSSSCRRIGSSSRRRCRRRHSGRRHWRRTGSSSASFLRMLS